MLNQRTILWGLQIVWRGTQSEAALTVEPWRIILPDEVFAYHRYMNHLQKQLRF
jgi:uncharacterized protein YjlB